MKLNFTKDGLLRAEEFRHLHQSSRALGGCVFYPSLGGKCVDGVDYKAVDLRIVDVDVIKDALETVAQVYGLDIQFKERSTNNE